MHSHAAGLWGSPGLFSAPCIPQKMEKWSQILVHGCDTFLSGAVFQPPLVIPILFSFLSCRLKNTLLMIRPFVFLFAVSFWFVSPLLALTICLFWTLWVGLLDVLQVVFLIWLCISLTTPKLSCYLRQKVDHVFFYFCYSKKLIKVHFGTTVLQVGLQVGPIGKSSDS